MLAGDPMNVPVLFRYLPDEKSGSYLAGSGSCNQTTCETLAGRKLHSYIYKYIYY